MAILGAGSEDAEDADAADFCGGALGEVVNIEGGALNGRPDLAIGWSAASAGSDGGSGFGDPTDPTELFGVGGGLGFGEAIGDVPIEIFGA